MKALVELVFIFLVSPQILAVVNSRPNNELDLLELESKTSTYNVSSLDSNKPLIDKHESNISSTQTIKIDEQHANRRDVQISSINPDVPNESSLQYGVPSIDDLSNKRPPQIVQQYGSPDLSIDGLRPPVFYPPQLQPQLQPQQLHQHFYPNLNHNYNSKQHRPYKIKNTHQHQPPYSKFRSPIGGGQVFHYQRPIFYNKSNLYKNRPPHIYQYGVPQPLRGVSGAPPTPPEIKYDGWQPIPGHVSRPSKPVENNYNNHNHYNNLGIETLDITRPAAVGYNSGLSDSYGAPLNTVTGSGGIVTSPVQDTASTHVTIAQGLSHVSQQHSGDTNMVSDDLSLGFLAAGINSVKDDVSLVKSIEYTLPDQNYGAPPLVSDSHLQISGLVPPSLVYGVDLSTNYGTTLHVNPARRPIKFGATVPEDSYQSIEQQALLKNNQLGDLLKGGQHHGSGQPVYVHTDVVTDLTQQQQLLPIDGAIPISYQNFELTPPAVQNDLSLPIHPAVQWTAPLRLEQEGYTADFNHHHQQKQQQQQMDLSVATSYNTNDVVQYDCKSGLQDSTLYGQSSPTYNTNCNGNSGQRNVFLGAGNYNGYNEGGAQINDGLLQSILSAIEQPRYINNHAGYHQPQSLCSLHKNYILADGNGVNVVDEPEGAYSAKNIEAVKTSQESPSVSDVNVVLKEIENKDDFPLIDNNNIALYFNNNSSINNEQSSRFEEKSNSTVVVVR